MRKALFFLYALCCLSHNAITQTKNLNTPYQVPAVIYIGDKGKFYFPLDSFSGITKGAEFFPQGFPQESDIVINNIEYNERENTIVIDFQAFRTGIVQLPVLDLGSIELKGLEVRIASLLDSGQNTMVLSTPAEPMSAPGTFWIITLFVLCVVIILFAVYFFWTNGRNFIDNLNTNIRTFFLIFSIKKTIRYVQKKLLKEKIGAEEAISILSGELRRFLSAFWHFNFFSMASEEFLSVSASFAMNCENETKTFLYNFFKHCDSLRFSGEGITGDAVVGIIADANKFVNLLKNKKNEHSL